MEPLSIKSKTYTKRKSVLWGIIFIMFGLVMETVMIVLIVTEGFAVVYVLAVLLFTIFIWAGFLSINMKKYPLELLADDKGIHYYIFDSKFGLGKHEILISWDAIASVTQYADEYPDPEDCDAALAVQLSEEPDNPAIIGLGDTEITSDDIGEVILKLNKLRRYYSKCQEAEGL